MNVQLRGHNFELSEPNRQYALDKLSHLTRFFEDDQISGTITAKKFQRSFKIEAMLSGEKLRIRSEVVSEDFYTGIDIVIEKLEKQIKKHKTKLQRYHHINVQEINTNSPENNDSVLEDEKVVRIKEVEIDKPMDIDEAILQFEMLGHNFFIFKERETLTVNILYRRNDGDYGLIKTI